MPIQRVYGKPMRIGFILPAGIIAGVYVISIIIATIAMHIRHIVRFGVSFIIMFLFKGLWV
jgi:hypothetical protein